MESICRRGFLFSEQNPDATCNVFGARMQICDHFWAAMSNVLKLPFKVIFFLTFSLESSTEK